MIRINLLAEGKKPVVSRPTVGRDWKSIAGHQQFAFALLVAIALLGALLLGGRYLMLEGRIGDLEQEVADYEVEARELERFIQEVEEFKAKQATLENKVRVINRLKANQQGPVQIMDYVSRALPELLWLNQMDVGPTEIIVSGEAFNTNAVANFMENLDRIDEFAEPELRDTSQRGQVYSFTLSFKYQFANSAAAGVEG